MDTLLLSGACGSGKSTLLQLGYRTWHHALGRTAAFDTDTLLMMVDPRWELTHDERRLDLLFEQCGLLATSFHRAKFDCVVIGGNALHTPDEINPLIQQLLEAGGVIHITLDPSIDEIRRRVAARGGDKRPSGSKPTCNGCVSATSAGPAASTTPRCRPLRRSMRSWRALVRAKAESHPPCQPPRHRSSGGSRR